MSKHAEIKIGDYKIPLIGISPKAVTEKCDGCGKDFHIQIMTMQKNSELLCQKCLQKRPTSKSK